MDSRAKTEHIHIRSTKLLKERIKKQAIKQNISDSIYITIAINEKLERDEKK